MREMAFGIHIPRTYLVELVVSDKTFRWKHSMVKKFFVANGFGTEELELMQSEETIWIGGIAQFTRIN